MQVQKKAGGAGGQAGEPVISDEMVFKVAKEIVVKYIEVGRLAPVEFDETFRDVYESIRRTVRKR